MNLNVSVAVIETPYANANTLATTRIRQLYDEERRRRSSVTLLTWNADAYCRRDTWWHRTVQLHRLAHRTIRTHDALKHSWRQLRQATTTTTNTVLYLYYTTTTTTRIHHCVYTLCVGLLETNKSISLISDNIWLRSCNPRQKCQPGHFYVVRCSTDYLYEMK